MALFRRKKSMPDGLWKRCDGCKSVVYKKAVEEGLNVCPECNYHFRISAWERVHMLLDENSFKEYWANMTPTDPLDFKDRITYRERVKSEQKKTGLKEAVLAGIGQIAGKDVILCATDSNFIMGSMGSVVGEKITRAAEMALKERIPLIIISGSGGGARMQEGAVSLMQMAKTCAAIARLQEASVLYISVLTDPTLGGVAASFSSIADIIIAEPKALIGFAGPRVIQETIKKTLPRSFQTSEFLLEHGFVDRIVDRKDLKQELATLIDYLQ